MKKTWCKLLAIALTASMLFSACGGFLVYLSKKQLIKRQESHKEAKEEK